MEERTGTSNRASESIGSNRKRSGSRDGSDRPNKNLQLKASKHDPVNTTSYVQILGNGMDTQDTSPSVLLFFDNQRFIFNAGEGFQRFCIEHKIKLSKLDHIFLSRVCSETAGGLPGLLLTLNGIGDVGVNVWGPTDLNYLAAAMEYFIPNAAMDRFCCFGQMHDSNGDAIPTSQKSDDLHVLIDDDVVKISAIVLQPSRVETGLNETKPANLSVIYICELLEIKGKFDPEKAASLGLNPGPKRRKLQLGEPVKSDRQDIMVLPSDVLGPSIPGPVVLLIDCPTPLHLQQLLSVQSLTCYYADTAGNVPESSKNVNCVIHLSPAYVTNTADYQIWMSKFGAAQHIMAGHEMKNIEVPILKASARMGARLNYLCPQFFPAPVFWSLRHQKCMPSGLKASNEDLASRIGETIPAENFLKFHLCPYTNLGLDKSSIPNLTSPSEIIDELLSEIPEIVDESPQLNQLWSGNEETSGEETYVQDNGVITEEPWLHDGELPGCLEDVTRDDMEIVFLGTGSSQPSKYRNVSSIFINLFPKGSLLLDCGEGTLGQLKRRFGIEGADEAVRCLRCIWISHIHADHHTGLARILALRSNLLKGIPHDPLIVIGPVQLKGYLYAYQRLEDLDMQFLDCEHTEEASLEAFNSNEDGNTILPECQRGDSTMFARGSRMQSCLKKQRSPVKNAAAVPVLKSLKKVLLEAGLETLISVPVEHCEPAFGVVLKAANRINRVGKTIPGWKIVYSGDTRPCHELIQASCGATVLIHEATFEDSLLNEAEAKKHSTTKEAVKVGDLSGVYRLILTHFSQRYPKIPKLDETHMLHKTCIAFDNMSVNLADLPVLPRVLQDLKLLINQEM
ncbi:tRNAse Z4 [Forsythia ovata]|uniref:ribonuclease Z n=1 Tax=Forsythia ovata TaxID=205694 RepID=A0ABD1WDF1_9LAMI